MSEDRISKELVSRAELEIFSEIYDRYQFSDDPTSKDSREAEIQYGQKAWMFYKEKVIVDYPEISYDMFYGKLCHECKMFLKKNKPNISALS